MTDLFGARTGACDLGAVVVEVEVTDKGRGRSGRRGTLAKLPAI